MGWRPPGPWTHVGLLEVPAGAEATGWQNLCIWPLWWEVALRGLRVSSEPPGPCCLGLGRASGCRVTAEREPRTSSRTCWDVPKVGGCLNSVESTLHAVTKDLSSADHGITQVV